MNFYDPLSSGKYNCWGYKGTTIVWSGPLTYYVAIGVLIHN